MATKKLPALDKANLFRLVIRIADELPYCDATLTRIAKAAKVPVTRLQAHFADLTQLLIATQQFTLEELRSNIIDATAHYPAGLERVRSATKVYLDHSLQRRGLRAWLLQARREEPLLAEGLRRQNHSFTLVISTEFQALGWPHPLAAARLYLAAIQEAARMEQVKGEPLAYIREAIWDIARFYTGTVKPGGNRQAPG